MSSLCNSLFFCRNRNLALSSVLTRSQPNMFTNINKETEVVDTAVILDVDEFLEKQQQEESVQLENTLVEETHVNASLKSVPTPVSEEKETEKVALFSPSQPDTLFWCIYTAVHGFNDYMEIDRNYGVKELEIKKQIADSLQKDASKIKNTNVKVTKVAIQEVLSDLLTTQKETNHMCLLAMISHYNINVILVDPTDRFYLEYTSNSESTFVLYKDTFGKYGMILDPVPNDWLSEFRTNKIRLESYLKPLRAVSTYKTDELDSLMQRVGGFDETKKYKKPELYDLISESIRWK
jgi:hypothetical protein